MEAVPFTRVPRDGLIVFDIGGTWFRSGLLTSEGRLVSVTRTPAVNFKTCPNLRVDELQQALVDYLVSETRRLSTENAGLRPGAVGISMGAALNAHTGYIWNSGPLWGPESKPFDLAAVLRAEEPATTWLVVNDITAALLWHVNNTPKVFTKTILITISSGIGCRMFDGRRQTVPVHPVFGIQGEIGHLPVTFRMGDRIIERNCDCGGPNHLNAFCSGSGIAAMLPVIANHYPDSYQLSVLGGQAPSELGFGALVEAVRQGDPFAMNVVDLVTLPLAEILLHQFTLDPEVDRVVLTGGVVHSLHPYYMESLMGHLERIGLYQVSSRDARFFRDRLEVGQSDDQAGLLGAALAVCGQEVERMAG